MLNYSRAKRPKDQKINKDYRRCDDCNRVFEACDGHHLVELEPNTENVLDDFWICDNCWKVGQLGKMQERA